MPRLSEIQIISDEAKGQFRRLMEARVKRDNSKAAAKKAEEEYREVEAEVWEGLEEAMGHKTLPVDLGEPFGLVKFAANETIYAKVIDQDKALEHYENRAMIEQVSAPKFVMARLSEEVRECYDQGKPMPPGLDFSPKRYITITQQKD